MRVYIGGFYIATNGVKISEEFAIVCLKLYSYCEEKEMCTVDVSNDLYHQEEESYDTSQLDGLSFFKRKWDKEGYDYDRGKTVLKEGRGEKLFTATNKAIPQKITDRESFNDGEIYLNCKGNIVMGCDWSYKSQDISKNIFCHVDHLKERYYLLSD